MKLPKCLQKPKLQLRSDLKLSPLSRFIVKDRSMMPGYFEGDHVLTFNWAIPKVGDVVVFQKDCVFLIKKLIKISSDIFEAKGDNQEEGQRIYRFGHKQLVGKVILRY